MANRLVYTERMIELLGENTMIFFPGLSFSIGCMFCRTPYNKAYKLLDIFASQFRDDSVAFAAWMMPMCKASAEEATECYAVLSKWCDDNLKEKY